MCRNSNLLKIILLAFVSSFNVSAQMMSESNYDIYNLSNGTLCGIISNPEVWSVKNFSDAKAALRERKYNCLIKNISKDSLQKDGYAERVYGNITLKGNYKDGLPNGVVEIISVDLESKKYLYIKGALQEPSTDNMFPVEEYTCGKLGFKKQTEKFANCVLDLYKRNNPIAQSNLNQSKALSKQLQSCGESKILPCYGEWVWKDGSKYMGEFRDGKFNGQGTVYNPDGSVKEKGVYVNDYLVSSPVETKLQSQPRQEITSSSQQSNYAQEQKNAKERQKGIDSMNCEAYAKNSTINQQPAVAYGDRSGITALLSATLIGMNTQDYYDSCMKRLGY
jgi:hypothetical protein